MADTLGTFRTMLARTVTIDEALSPYLGRSPQEAHHQAEDARTTDDLLMPRLQGLVTILALREAPSNVAMLAAALLWRSAPVATTVDELREAIHRIHMWQDGLDDHDVARIAGAHRRYTVCFEKVMARTGDATGPEIDALYANLVLEADGDTLVAELGTALLIVQMTDGDFFVGLEDERGVIIVMDRVPHIGDDGWYRDKDHHPIGPGPRLLLDA